MPANGPEIIVRHFVTEVCIAVLFTI